MLRDKFHTNLSYERLLLAADGSSYRDTWPKLQAELQFNCKSLHSHQHGRGGGRIARAREVADTTRTQTTESSKKVSQGFTETVESNAGHIWVYYWPSINMFDVYLGVFAKLQTLELAGQGDVLNLLATVVTHFLLLGCVALP